MGENEGSSDAAQRAQSATDTTTPPKNGGFLSRVIGALSPGEAASAPPALSQSKPQQSHGMINLRRMRVEDVAVPK
ncbi:MAG: magnesium/cobalt efflux protein, partial [Pseudomonadota bacterium]